MAAQSVVELEAGGTSLYDSYGVAAHLYTARADGWIGVGVQDGDFVLGAAVQTSFKQDSLRIGSDVLVERYPTDLFSLGVNILGQDVRYTLVRPRTYITSSAAGPPPRTRPSSSRRTSSAIPSAR